MNTALSTTLLRRLGAVLKWAVVATLLVLIVRVIATNWADLSGSAISCDWTYLVLAAALLCVHFLMCALLWHELTVANETAIDRGEAIRAWFYSLLGKYFPGKILLWAGRVLPYRRAGHGVKRVTACFILELAFQLLAACIIGLVALAYAPDSPLQDYRRAAWLLIIVLAGAIHPRVLQSLLNLGLRILRREPVTIEIKVRQMLVLFLGYLTNSLVLGAAFLLFVKALYPVGADQFLYLTAAFLIAGSIGILSVFAPGGLGVREGGLMLALCVIMPQPAAAVIVLAARVWTTAGELLCVAITFIHDRLTRRSRMLFDTSRAAGFSPRGPTPTNHRSTLILLSLLGFALVWISTTRYGVGLSPDSVNYIATARNLLAGKGYLTFDDTPFTHWAPLLPTMLAGLGAVGVEPQVGARLINAASFALIIFFCGQLFMRHAKSRALAVLGAVSILLANPLFGHCALALTEPTFVLLSILLFIALIKFMQTPSLRLLMFSALPAALCFLDRYSGVAMIVCGAAAIVLVAKHISMPRRFAYGCLFGFVSVLPGSLWMLRNYMVLDAISEGWPPATFTFIGNLSFMLDTLSSWFLPENIALWIRLPAIGGVLAAMAAVIAVLPSPQTADPTSERRTFVALAAIFALVYTVVLFSISMTIKIEELDNRMMLPVYVFLFFMLIVLADRVLESLRAWRPNARWATTTMLVFCALWLMYPLARVSRGVWRRAHLGAGGFNTMVWRDSPVMRDLRTSPPAGTIYSNRADAIYILNHMDAYWGPSKRIGLEPFLETMNSGPDNYLVWFNLGRNSSYHPDELPDSFASELITRFPDGAIYRFERR